MKTTSKIAIGVSIGLVLIISLIYFSVSVSYKNDEARLRNLVAGQSQSNQANFDKMFKVIAQIAQVADQYKDAFKEIYPQLIEGRYSGEKGGSLMKWVQESNPTFDTSLYNKLADAIEAQREEFFMEQQKLIDYQREHKNLVMTWPGSVWFSASDTIPIKIVTSAVAKQAFTTGEENDIDIFKK
jgi:hypothetical protein